MLVRAEDLVVAVNTDRTMRGETLITQRQVEDALSDIDQELAIEASRQRVTWNVWDGETNIRHLSPSEFRAHLRKRGEPADASIYLGYIDGQLTMIQPFEPFVEGHTLMDDDRAAGVAQAHLIDGCVLHREENQLYVAPPPEVVERADDTEDDAVQHQESVATSLARAAVIETIYTSLEEGRTR